jgi:hypothetical protein
VRCTFQSSALLWLVFKFLNFKFFTLNFVKINFRYDVVCLQVLESRTKLGSQISAPLVAMGSGVLLSACGVIPPSAAAYNLVISLRIDS